MVVPVHCKECGLVLPGVSAFYDHCQSRHGMTYEEASLQELKEIEGELYDSEVQEPVKSSFWSGGGSKEREVEEYEKEYLKRHNITADDDSDKNSKEKGSNWRNKNIDLENLTHKIADWFYADGFPEVRKEISRDKTQYIVQARKGGMLRTLTSTRKALTVVIEGRPDNFHIKVGTGEWGKGVAMAVVLTGVIGMAGLGFNAVFREKVWSNIKSIVASLENTELDETKGTPEFCENCGNKLNPKAKFCSKCGTPRA
jgi:hypothetical protein